MSIEQQEECRCKYNLLGLNKINHKVGSHNEIENHKIVERPQQEMRGVHEQIAQAHTHIGKDKK